MKTLRYVLIVLISFLLITPDSKAQENKISLPPEAKERLDHIIGTWDSRWDYLDQNGKVTNSLKGIETGRYLYEGTVVELITKVEGRPKPSTAWMFYDNEQETFFLSSIDYQGNFWLLSGGLEEFIITSTPRKRADGSYMTIRFTHSNMQKDSVEALMEYSTDDGKTWTKGFRQYLTRRKG